ncbi:hypothetical protein BX666DRAFT_1919538 [Dichotomocladium elegans]|nr:hypothetical protein BX666DRAFT_1919538 [Dichotomocladium elegans]
MKVLPHQVVRLQFSFPQPPTHPRKEKIDHILPRFLNISTRSSGSKFNFQFWADKARDVFRNVNKKNSNTSVTSNVRYQHAITTDLSPDISVPNTMRSIMDRHPIYDKMTNKLCDSPTSIHARATPIATASAPLPSTLRSGTTATTLHQRKNNISPTSSVRIAPGGSVLRNPRLSEARSTASSSEGSHSPRTPNGPPRNPLESFFNDKRRPCLRCRREVADGMGFIRVSRGVYHTQCFSCYTCRKKLQLDKGLLEYEGRPYCEMDYNIMVKQQPSCAACGEAIAPHVRPTRAFGKLYHPEHLRCFHCKKPVDPDMTGLVEHKNKIFCRPDFNTMYLPKCRGCGRAVEKEAVSSADGKLQGRWHKHCFNCYACHEPFSSNVFYVYNNMPYCRRHYHQMNNSLCKGCNEPVEGRCAQTSEGWRFHPQCFRCSICNTYITDIYYTSENHIFCRNDYQHRSKNHQTLFEDEHIVNNSPCL